VTNYGSASVRASSLPAKHVYARQRLFAGALAGFLLQLLVAFVLGMVLAGGFALTVRVGATLTSSMIATPLALTVGFAFMLKEESRSFGGGIVGGAVIATIVLVLLYFVL
jgi:hypothetical protein